MTNILDAANKLHVAVELLESSFAQYATPQTLDLNNLKDRLKEYLGDMVSDLKIDVALGMDIRFFKQQEDRDDLEHYHIYVNGTKCRLEWPARFPGPEITDAPRLAAAIAKGCYENRDLMITPQLSEYLLESWLAEAGVAYWPGLPVDEFTAFLRRFVRRGFSVERGRDITVNYCRDNENGWDAASRFEEAVFELEATGIALYRGKHYQSDDASKAISEEFDQISDMIRYDLGLNLPKICLPDNDIPGDDTIQLQLNDLRQPPFHAGSMEAIVEYLKSAVRKQAANFLNLGMVKFRLDQLRTHSPAFIEAVEARFGRLTLLQILRSLLDEQVAIADLPRILESMLAVNRTAAIDSENLMVFFPNTAYVCPVANPKTLAELTVEDYVNLIRIQLIRSIIYRSADSYYSNHLSCYMLAPRIEKELRKVEPGRLKNSEFDGLRQQIYDKLENARTAVPIILTGFDVRKKVRILMEMELPRLVVLSIPEIPAYIKIQNLGKIP